MFIICLFFSVDNPRQTYSLSKFLNRILVQELQSKYKSNYIAIEPVPDSSNVPNDRLTLTFQASEVLMFFCNPWTLQNSLWEISNEIRPLRKKNIQPILFQFGQTFCSEKHYTHVHFEDNFITKILVKHLNINKLNGYFIFPNPPKLVLVSVNLCVKLA